MHTDLDHAENNPDCYSVYNAAPKQLPSHKLQDLLPDNDEHGWHVSRNLKKPLNHLSFLSGKERTAELLNLHNSRTETRLFNQNFALLKQHQERQVSTSHIIEELRRQTGFGTSTVTAALREYATITHMEWHPTDVCNLTCHGCTYGHDDPVLKPPPVQFDYRSIGRISLLNPKSVVIIGGGEPTLYRSQGRSFNDAVQALVDTNPGVTLALVTNGTHQPPGNWTRHFQWVRLSLDAATPETYKAFRGKPLFDRVLNTFLAYLETSIPQVGISFLFAKQNVHEYADVAKMVFELVHSRNPAALARVNIQYRPLRRDPYRYQAAFHEAVSAEEIRTAVSAVRHLADSSTKIHQFLKKQTNITAILGGNSHPPHAFERCYYSQVFHIIRANGDIRPCFIRVNEPEFVLGNIHSDSLETIALNTLYVGARQMPHCDSHGCRQCHVNFTFEQGLAGKILPSTAPDVQQDLMF